MIDNLMSRVNYASEIAQEYSETCANISYFKYINFIIIYLTWISSCLQYSIIIRSA